MQRKLIPEDFNINNYTFSLPKSQVAQYPTHNRSKSKLMVLHRSDGSTQEDIFQNIAEYLPSPSLMVLNTTKVFPARLIGNKKETSGKVEFLLLTPLPLIQHESEEKGYKRAVISGLIKSSGKVRPEQVIRFSPNLFLQVIEKFDFGQVRANLYWSGHLPELLSAIGQVPLPPYIKRSITASDQKRYQTIYANDQKSGSVAAPTAGLHFTRQLLDEIQSKNIVCAPINLHVGYGTFSPVREHDIRDHKIHSEFFEITSPAAEQIEQARINGYPIIAVGTTTVRALETLMEKFGYICPYRGWTDLYICPGYRFKAVNHLITNFHLPYSSLLLMVSAFVGKDILLAAYDKAVQKHYRFFSYGDVMLIL